MESTLKSDLEEIIESNTEFISGSEIPRRGMDRIDPYGVVADVYRYIKSLSSCKCNHNIEKLFNEAIRVIKEQKNTLNETTINVMLRTTIAIALEIESKAGFPRIKAIQELLNMFDAKEGKDK